MVSDHSPASVIQFSPISSKNVENKEKMKAEMFLKVKPDVKNPVMFKVSAIRVPKTICEYYISSCTPAVFITYKNV